MQVLFLQRSFFAWVGTAASLQSLDVAMLTQAGQPAASELLARSLDGGGLALAARLGAPRPRPRPPR